MVYVYLHDNLRILLNFSGNTLCICIPSTLCIWVSSIQGKDMLCYYYYYYCYYLCDSRKYIIMCTTYYTHFLFTGDSYRVSAKAATVSSRLTFDPCACVCACVCVCVPVCVCVSRLYALPDILLCSVCMRRMHHS